MNTKLDVTRRSVAPAMQEFAETVDNVFEPVILKFLKQAAESGLDLEQVTITVFDEVFAPSDIQLFDGTLGSFLNLLLDEGHLRQRLGNSMLDVIMPATVQGYDIYQLIDELEARVQSQSNSVARRAPVIQKSNRRAVRTTGGMRAAPSVSGITGTPRVSVTRHRAS